MLFTVAATLAIAALVMPTGWYDAIPHQADLPRPPVSGVALLRGLLAVQALLLAVAAGFRWYPSRLNALDRATGIDDWADPNDMPAARATWWLGAISMLALALRLYHANADLWLDEISPIVDYGGMPVLQVFGSYLRSNNHLLNTLLVKLSVAVFGEHEWSVRLPAIVFGTATIPAVYWCARLGLSRRASLGAAVLLAVSYHHIFFSQNARGYSAYILFAVLATRLFGNGLRDDSPAVWVSYIASIVLGFAALLNMGFVLAGHGLIALAACWLVHRSGRNALPLVRRFTLVFAIAAMGVLELYIVALPEVYVVITHVYKVQSTGFAPFSFEFARELGRGVAAGFGPGLLVAAIPLLGIAIAGFVALMRRCWVVALGLALPGVLTATFLLARGLTFSPRFFLLWVPLTMIAAALTVEIAAQRLVPGVPWRAHLVTAVVIIALASVSIASLRRYYAVPKQPYRQAIAAVEGMRKPADDVIVLYLAESGIRYYGARLNAPLTEHYRFVRTMSALDSALARRSDHRTFLIMTFERAFRMDLPEIYGRAKAGWTERAHFDATVGDGGIGVWEENRSMR